MGTLVFRLWHGTVQATQVSGTSTDVDNERAVQEVEAVGNRERLGANDDRIDAR